MKTKPFSVFGQDLFGEPITKARAPLEKRFIIPPFSVLNARDESWKERKRAWLSLGIESEVGRGGRAYDLHDWFAEVDNQGARTDFAHGWGKGGGLSIFDPVLCELMYSWFCKPGGKVIDPFAGGSVRGIVASLMGRPYWGSDLNPVQVKANQEQAARILGTDAASCEWVCREAIGALTWDSPLGDFIFSCPPYGNLERYSDDPKDLSTMKWPEFQEAYAEVIQMACRRLLPNRFACFVVGNFRERRGKQYHGQLRDLTGLTVRCFENEGCEFYNEAILVTSLGSLPIRVTQQFVPSRKLGRTHQNVLVFVKGDWRKAVQSITD